MEVGAGEEGWAWCTLSSSCSHHANGNIFTGGFKKVPDIRLCNTQSPWVLQVGKKQGLELEPREQVALRSVCLISCLSQPLCAAVVPAASLWICCQPSGREFRPRLTLIFGKWRSVTWSGWWIHELTQSVVTSQDLWKIMPSRLQTRPGSSSARCSSSPSQCPGNARSLELISYLTSYKNFKFIFKNNVEKFIYRLPRFIYQFVPLPSHISLFPLSTSSSAHHTLSASFPALLHMCVSVCVYSKLCIL